METHLVTVGGLLLQVPLTYRDEPLDSADDALIAEMDHSVLGTRWVYDGLRDPRFVVMMAAVAMTGQGEALGMAVYDGRWYVAPSNVRIEGGGWTQERVPVSPRAGRAKSKRSSWPRFARGRTGLAAAKPGVGRTIGSSAVVGGRPRQDSNLGTRFRKPMLYPLSYEGGGWRKGGAEPPGLRCGRSA
jgi:hypothetical protein